MRCNFPIEIRDPRMKGASTHMCQLQDGHEGEHQTASGRSASPPSDDRSRLLQEIPRDKYDWIMERLKELRQKHPSYRDDELLMYLCWMYMADTPKK